MTRSREAAAYDTSRVRHELQTLEMRNEERRHRRFVDILARERAVNPNDRITIGRRVREVEKSDTRIDRMRASRDRMANKIQAANRSLAHRLNDEYTLMRQRGYARELAEQIARENNSPLEDGYYEQVASQEFEQILNMDA